MIENICKYQNYQETLFGKAAKNQKTRNKSIPLNNLLVYGWLVKHAQPQTNEYLLTSNKTFLDFEEISLLIIRYTCFWFGFHVTFEH